MVATAKANPSLLHAVPDQRGKKKCDHNELHEKIDTHIHSFNPCISHYRREHAPNRLYLPHELTINAMHQDFLEKNADTKINYTTYMRRVNAMNIVCQAR